MFIYINIYIYIYITNISHITQSDKEIFFDKTKTIRPKTWLIDFTKKPLMTYHLPKTTLHILFSQFSPRFFFFGGGRGRNGPPLPLCMSVPGLMHHASVYFTLNRKCVVYICPIKDQCNRIQFFCMST